MTFFLNKWDHLNQLNQSHTLKNVYHNCNMPLNKKISRYQENIITIFYIFGFIFMDLFAIQVVLLNNLVHIYCSRVFIKKL